MGSLFASVSTALHSAEGIARSPLGLLLHLIPGAGGILAVLPAIDGVVASIQHAQNVYGVSNGPQKLALAVSVVQAAVPVLAEKSQAEAEDIINKGVAFLNSMHALPTAADHAAIVAAVAAAPKAIAPPPPPPPPPIVFATTAKELDALVHQDAEESK